MSQLHDYINQCHGRAFSLGTFDGALFALGWLEVLERGAFGKPFKGGYSSLKGAFKALKKAGYKDITALADAHLTRLASWMQARPGDIAIIGKGRKACVGIVSGSLVHVVSPRGGLDVIAIDQVTEVYRP